MTDETAMSNWMKIRKVPGRWQIGGFFLWLGLILSGIVSASDEITLSARLDRTEVPLNREVTMEVEIRWQGAADAIQILTPDPPRITNLNLIATASENRVEARGEEMITIREYRFTFQPQALGMAYVDEIRLRYKDRDNQEHVLETPRLQVKVVDPVPEPRKSFVSPIAILATVLIVAGSLGAISWREYSEKKRARELAQKQEKSLEEIYHERLKESVDLASDDLPQQYAALSHLLRAYIRARLKLEDQIGTTEEMLQALERAETPLDTRSQVQEIFQACDVVKFSGASADPNQLARLYGMAEQIIVRGSIVGSHSETPQRET